MKAGKKPTLKSMTALYKKRGFRRPIGQATAYMRGYHDANLDKEHKSSFGALYIDTIKDRDRSPKQEKINKLMMKPNATAADWKLLAKLLTDDGK